VLALARHLDPRNNAVPVWRLDVDAYRRSDLRHQDHLVRRVLVGPVVRLNLEVGLRDGEIFPVEPRLHDDRGVFRYDIVDRVLDLLVRLSRPHLDRLPQHALNLLLHVARDLRHRVEALGVRLEIALVVLVLLDFLDFLLQLLKRGDLVHPNRDYSADFKRINLRFNLGKDGFSNKKLHPWYFKTCENNE
jgi:hypothetical protein